MRLRVEVGRHGGLQVVAMDDQGEVRAQTVDLGCKLELDLPGVDWERSLRVDHHWTVSLEPPAASNNHHRSVAQIKRDLGIYP